MRRKLRILYKLAYTIHFAHTVHLFIYLWTCLFIHFTRFPRHSYFSQNRFNRSL